MGISQVFHEPQLTLVHPGKNNGSVDRHRASFHLLCRFSGNSRVLGITLSRQSSFLMGLNASEAF